jgi:hypothetical protein
MPASEQITAHIAALGDWRGKTMARLRTIIGAAAPGLVEEWKWNTPVWSANGNVLALGAFSDHVKINFFKGASLPDPRGLFNAGLEAKASRAIDIHQGDAIDETGLRDLVRAAVALNGGGAGANTKAAPSATKAAKTAAKKATTATKKRRK